MFSSIVNAVISALGLIMVGIIGWAVSISNRVAVLEADKSSLRELITTQFEEIKRRLNVLEQKIDRRHNELAD